jgi:hypothetical protein
VQGEFSNCAKISLTHNCLFCIFNSPQSEFLSKTAPKTRKKIVMQEKGEPLIMKGGGNPGAGKGATCPSTDPGLARHAGI